MCTYLRGVKIIGNGSQFTCISINIGNWFCFQMYCIHISGYVWLFFFHLFFPLSTIRTHESVHFAIELKSWMCLTSITIFFFFFFLRWHIQSVFERFIFVYPVHKRQPSFRIGIRGVGGSYWSCSYLPHGCSTPISNIPALVTLTCFTFFFFIFVASFFLSNVVVYHLNDSAHNVNVIICWN